jgi:aminoglycoside 6'-N-acetyltransferase
VRFDLKSALVAMLPVVQGDTTVRRFRPEDVAAFHAYRCDAEVARYQGWSSMTRAAAQAFVDEMVTIVDFERGGWIQLAIAETASDELLGDLGLFLGADESIAEIGFTLGRPAQGHGHATRAVRTAMRLLFERTAVARVRAITDARNTASIRLLERSGFTLSASRQAPFKGETCTEHVFLCERPTSPRR